MSMGNAEYIYQKVHPIRLIKENDNIDYDKLETELLNSMSIDRKLDYAELLVFVKYDLRNKNGLPFIKQEANNGNPKAEFLMYKYYFIGFKNLDMALRWLRKSYEHNYREAKLLVWEQLRIQQKRCLRNRSFDTVDLSDYIKKRREYFKEHKRYPEDDGIIIGIHR